MKGLLKEVAGKFLLLIVIILTAAAITWVMVRFVERPAFRRLSSADEVAGHEYPAPGFTIVCDLEAGLYAPSDAILVYHGMNHTNKQSAIDHSWTLYLKRSKPSTRNWQDCD